MSKNSRGPGRVPDRWLHCPRKSSRLIAERFLAFKTPLSEQFDSQVPDDCRFTPKMLFSLTKSYGQRIGLWIDLTNTDRFYNCNDIKRGYGDNKEVAYVKLQCRGHGETPDQETTDTFIRFCNEFSHRDPLSIIGVHCTHGFNRTGFLIVSYLVQEMDWGLEAAINEFSNNRPPGIYKDDYIQELYRRYEPDSDPISAAPRPDWCLEFDDSTEEDSSPTKKQRSSTEREPSGGKKRFKNGKVPQFMEGIEGIEIVTSKETIRYVQQAAQEMCNCHLSGFPGAQPVSMDRDNIDLLRKKPYMVSWKADGTRYMMAILDENEVYMLDRDNNVFQVCGLRFVERKNLDAPLKWTLLDGEMVIDKHEGQNIPRYLVYDIIRVSGIDVSELRFSPERMKTIETDIIKPRQQAMEIGKIIRENEPFSIRAKQFLTCGMAYKFLDEKFARQLTHEPDGLIFQPSAEPYIAGQCPEVLKWKPPSHNSVDFRLKIQKEEGVGLLTKKVGFLYVGGFDPSFARMKYTKELEKYDGKIIECRFENNTWIFMRERTDKSFPNSYKTARSVFNSIKNPVTKDILLEFIATSRYKTDNDIMPPPQMPPRHRR